ncbi:vWA domain-containing protein [Fulvivirga imtechensis]|nr:VWA domain-containing protein [Fulvivirga imtechensis]
MYQSNKYFLLFVSLLCGVLYSNAYAQDVADINKQVAFSNEIAANITHHNSYMKHLYGQLNGYKDDSRTRITYEIARGMKQADGYLYNKAVSAGGGHAQKIKQHYDELTNMNNNLAAYIKLEDYNSDHGDQGLRLIDEMQTEVLNLSKARKELCDLVYSRRSNYSNHISGKVYRLMIDVVDHEEQILRYLDAASEPLDESLMVKSYLETAEKLLELDKDIALPYPANMFLRSFASGVKNLQRIKQRAVDENNFAAQRSTRHSQDVYKDFLNYFNNDVLAFLESFVQASEGKGLKMSLYPKYIPLLKLRENEFDVRIEPRPFTDRKMPKTEIVQQSLVLDRITYQALNSYVEALNVRTRALLHLQNNIRNFRSSLQTLQKRDEASRKTYKLRFDYDHFMVPEVDMALLRVNTPKVLPAYSSSLTIQMENIQEIMLEYERLCEELSVYSENKLFVTAGFDRPEEILNRFLKLNEIYETRKEQLYSDVRTIYSSYSLPDRSNPWIISSGALLHATEISKHKLYLIRGAFAEDSRPTISTDTLLAIRRDLVSNQSEYMKGIQRIGRYHGHCPYNPYEDMPERIKVFVDKMGYISSYLEKGDKSKYADYVYVYNDMVEKYNKFAELGRGEVESAENDKLRPVFILYQTSTFAPFAGEEGRTNTPHTAHQNAPATTPPNADKPAVKTNETNEMAETHKSHQQVIRDTVYIETVRTDTVYLHEGDKDFTSFEGYATNNLVFLLDASGSMDKPDRLPLLKQSMSYLISLMRAEDEISIIIYSGKAKLALKPTSAAESDVINQVIANLSSEGRSNVNDGIELAYKVADKNYKRGGNNRIIVATDGEIQIGKSAMNIIEKFARQDIQLTIFTFGNVESDRLRSVSEVGHGNYRHITRQNVNGQLIREAKAKRLQ